MKKDNKKSRILIIIAVIILLISIIIVVSKVVSKGDDDGISNINPVIYYNNKKDELKIPIDEDITISQSIKIVWTNECTGIIKKDGKIFSKENNVDLLEDGEYELTSKSPDGKNKITRKVIIDTTPPKVEIKGNSSGTYTIVFEDINDIKTAILIRINEGKKEEINLIEEGLKKEIEIKEKGAYILRAADYNENSTRDNLKFIIK